MISVNKMARYSGPFLFAILSQYLCKTVINRSTIKEFLAQTANAIIIDVRSPGEYNHAHIPGAINIPLFTNEERKIVGTSYKQQSREQAIKIGLDFFGPKIRSRRKGFSCKGLF